MSSGTKSTMPVTGTGLGGQPIPAGRAAAPALRVSIITPSFNRREFLEQTIHSVAAQTYPNVEHIIVDGGSEDGTLEMLKHYEARLGIRWLAEPDSGMYDAIDKGLALANGDILAYLNSDDLYFPWTIETVARKFSTVADADVVFGDVLSVDEHDHAQRIHWQYPFDLDYIRRVGFLAQPAVFWRRQVRETEGDFDRALRFVADCDYWMRIGERQRFVKVNELVAVERNHRSTLRASSSEALNAELAVIRARYVHAGGAANRLALIQHRIRIALIRRLYWLAFSANLLTPKRMRSERWKQFLGLAELRPSLIAILAHQVPFIGPRFEDEILKGWPYVPDLQ